MVNIFPQTQSLVMIPTSSGQGNGGSGSILFQWKQILHQILQESLQTKNKIIQMYSFWQACLEVPPTNDSDLS